jgi:hypothetical protein
MRNRNGTVTIFDKRVPNIKQEQGMAVRNTKIDKNGTKYVMYKNNKLVL